MIRRIKALPGDSAKLALRPEDAAEVSPDWRTEVEAQIARGAAAAFWDGTELVALAGVCTGPDLACPWLLCSPSVARHRATLMRRSRAVVGGLREVEETVGNYIGKQSLENRKFIQALGFVILPSPSGDHDFFYLPKNV